MYPSLHIFRINAHLNLSWIFDIPRMNDIFSYSVLFCYNAFIHAWLLSSDVEIVKQNCTLVGSVIHLAYTWHWYVRIWNKLFHLNSSNWTYFKINYNILFESLSLKVLIACSHARLVSGTSHIINTGNNLL